MPVLHTPHHEIVPVLTRAHFYPCVSIIHLNNIYALEVVLYHQSSIIPGKKYIASASQNERFLICIHLFITQGLELRQRADLCKVLSLNVNSESVKRFEGNILLNDH